MQEHAFESSQKYKEGKFIIELAHMIKENGWDWSLSSGDPFALERRPAQRQFLFCFCWQHQQPHEITRDHTRPTCRHITHYSYRTANTNTHMTHFDKPLAHTHTYTQTSCIDTHDALDPSPCWMLFGVWTGVRGWWSSVVLMSSANGQKEQGRIRRFIAHLFLCLIQPHTLKHNNYD